jgi:hypothetical protein
MKLALCAGACVLLLSGCQSLTMAPGAPTTVPKPVPVVINPPQPSVPAPVPTTPAPRASEPTEVLPPPVIESAPVPRPATPASTLLTSVDEALAANDFARASALCERALRISPRDALLWYRLADIRLRQQRWQEAVANARRGLLYVGTDVGLKAQLNHVLQQVTAATGVQPN